MPIETDRERIIRAIGCCISDPDGKRACDKCPYGEAQANGQHCQNLMHNDALDLLKEQEAVVRCKDCEHATMTADGKTCKYCEMDTDDFGDQREVYHEADWFCADGERRTE